jgi:hypothetical protein
MYLVDGFNIVNEFLFEKLIKAFELCNEDDATACYLKKIDLTQDFHGFFYVPPSVGGPIELWRKGNNSLSHTAVLSRRLPRRGIYKFAF